VIAAFLALAVSVPFGCNRLHPGLVININRGASVDLSGWTFATIEPFVAVAAGQGHVAAIAKQVIGITSARQRVIALFAIEAVASVVAR
jgi:hypothetical protein